MERKAGDEPVPGYKTIVRIGPLFKRLGGPVGLWSHEIDLLARLMRGRYQDPRRARENSPGIFPFQRDPLAAVFSRL